MNNMEQFIEIRRKALRDERMEDYDDIQKTVYSYNELMLRMTSRAMKDDTSSFTQKDWEESFAYYTKDPKIMAKVPFSKPPEVISKEKCQEIVHEYQKIYIENLDLMIQQKNPTTQEEA